MKQKKKVVRKQGTLIAQIHLGGEPELPSPYTKIDLIRCFNWYNDCSEQKHRSEWLAAWARINLSEVQADILDRHGHKCIATFAFMARMHTMGANFTDEHLMVLDQGVKDFLAKVEEDEEEKQIKKEQFDVKTIVKERDLTNDPIVLEAVTAIDLSVDQFFENQNAPLLIPEQLQVLQGHPDQIQRVEEHIRQESSDYRAILGDDFDEQLAEGYGSIIQYRGLKKIVGWFDGVLEKLGELRVKRQVRQQRAPRAKKQLKPDRVAKWVRYQPSSAEFQLTSIKPERAVGAQLVTTFNTKTRMLAFYEGESLSFKGTRIIGYTRALQKKLRKPEKELPAFLTATRAGSLRNFEGLRTQEHEGNPRFGQHTVILKVFV